MATTILMLVSLVPEFPVFFSGQIATRKRTELEHAKLIKDGHDAIEDEAVAAAWASNNTSKGPRLRP